MRGWCQSFARTGPVSQAPGGGAQRVASGPHSGPYGPVGSAVRTSDLPVNREGEPGARGPDRTQDRRSTCVDYATGVTKRRSALRQARYQAFDGAWSKPPR